MSQVQLLSHDTHTAQAFYETMSSKLVCITAEIYSIGETFLLLLPDMVATC